MPRKGFQEDFYLRLRFRVPGTSTTTFSTGFSITEKRFGKGSVLFGKAIASTKYC
jgi:hypothetical protein